METHEDFIQMSPTIAMYRQTYKMLKRKWATVNLCGFIVEQANG